MRNKYKMNYRKKKTFTKTKIQNHKYRKIIRLVYCFVIEK